MSLGDPTSHERFGQELRDCRIDSGVGKQAVVAEFISEQLGVSCSVSTLYAWEGAKTKPRGLNLAKVRKLERWFIEKAEKNGRELEAGRLSRAFERFDQEKGKRGKRPSPNHEHRRFESKVREATQELGSTGLRCADKITARYLGLRDLVAFVNDGVVPPEAKNDVAERVEALRALVSKSRAELAAVASRWRSVEHLEAADRAFALWRELDRQLERVLPPGEIDWGYEHLEVTLLAHNGLEMSKLSKEARDEALAVKPQQDAVSGKLRNQIDRSEQQCVDRLTRALVRLEKRR